MSSLREIEPFLGPRTHEKSLVKALPMNECVRAELFQEIIGFSSTKSPIFIGEGMYHARGM